jgi:hypothetical protein
MAHNLRCKVAYRRVGDVSHEHGLEMTVLEWGNVFFPLETAKGGDDFGQGNTGETELCGLVAPREDIIRPLFANIALDKGG